ncbi:Pentatricopeptide repeat-containing protein [Thalictrum thalictroides]|uniref:Pentatricopeptide repeat-containing protein n=1 Tax=Thalictrum thalictroides TaxID=46969 RepID=A0A7J6WM88_THATH|nr:Pentatricopeptide repeat-containing protein [Thalictrum thalictroides]
MIAGYTQNGREKDAMEMYVEMRRSGVVPDQFAFGSVVRACVGLKDVELGKQLHADVLKSELGCELIPQNALVAMYTKFDQIDKAWIVFDKIVYKDLVSWGSVIGGFGQQGYELEALEFFKEMLSLGVYCPNEFIFGSVLSACGGLFQSEYGSEIHGLSIKFGLGKDRYVGCSLCHMYAKCGSLESAKTAFHQIDNPDVVSWNAFIAAIACSGDSNESMSLFSQMRHLGFVPDGITISRLLSSFTSFATLYQGMQIHSYVIKKNLGVNVPVMNNFLTMYSRCSDFSDAVNIFDEMTSNVNLVSWNAILTACLHHNLPDEACRYLKLMQTSQYRPDQITLTSALNACALLASLERGCQIHDYAIKSGYEAETSISNGLIDMYTKCGSPSDARKHFETMDNPDVVSWSSLIVGYAQFGYGEKALKLFRTMRDMGIKPNHVTFVGVLSACSHVGLLEEGRHYYETMETEHGVTPTREHCSCVVDMLARAGRLREAENFISQMSFDPDIVVWKTLLGACRTCGDVEVGKRAAEKVLELDPSNSSAHVLLCNIYASTGSWDDVARVRKLMRSKGVRKDLAQSWIELRKRVHEFSVEDRLHPQMDEIYSLLETLWLQITTAAGGSVLDQKVALVEHLQE